MKRLLRLLACLPLLAGAACAADSVAGPAPQPEREKEPEAAAQLAPAPEPAAAAATPSVLTRSVSATSVMPEPLFVVDGVIIFDADALRGIDPNDIESIEVIKEAVAASLYGTRAPGSIVLITTRSGAARSSRRR